MSKLCNSLVFAALIVLSVSSCVSTATPEIRYAGGNGSDPSQAVVILGADTESEFRAAEEAWIRQAMPGATWDSGEYVMGPCACHAVKLTTADGAAHTVYFDMSEFGR